MGGLCRSDSTVHPAQLRRLLVSGISPPKTAPLTKPCRLQWRKSPYRDSGLGPIHSVHELGYRDCLHRLGGAGHYRQLHRERMEDLQEESSCSGPVTSFRPTTGGVPHKVRRFSLFIEKNHRIFGIITEVLIVIAAK